MSSNGTLALGEVRAALATVLAPATDDDPVILVDYPDTVTPPALLVVWDDPWLEQARTMGPVITTANLMILCVGSRVDPGAGIDTLERLVPYVIDRLRAAPQQWPTGTVEAPAQWTISNVNYLAARIGYRVPVTV